jgi:hypothetical protein
MITDEQPFPVGTTLFLSVAQNIASVSVVDTIRSQFNPTQTQFAYRVVELYRADGRAAMYSAY